MKLKECSSHRHAKRVLEIKYPAIINELTRVLESISIEQLHSQLKVSTNTKSISNAINELIKIRLGRLGWQVEPYIFPEDALGDGKIETAWRLDFASCGIAVEVAFNHGEAIAWNLLKPVIASELNHVEKQLQTEIGIVIAATESFKRIGHFDSAVGSIEKYERYLKPLNNQLTIPVLLIGLDSFKDINDIEQLSLTTVIKEGKEVVDVKAGVSSIGADWETQLKTQSTFENSVVSDLINDYCQNLPRSSLRKCYSCMDAEALIDRYEYLTKLISALNRELKVHHSSLEYEEYHPYEKLKSSSVILDELANSTSKIIEGLNNDFNQQEAPYVFGLNKDGRTLNKLKQKYLNVIKEKIKEISNLFRDMKVYQSSNSLDDSYKVLYLHLVFIERILGNSFSGHKVSMTYERKRWNSVGSDYLRSMVDSNKIFDYLDSLYKMMEEIYSLDFSIPGSYEAFNSSVDNVNGILDWFSRFEIRARLIPRLKKKNDA